MPTIHDDPPNAGLILAGGLGRRWGTPKAWAQLPDGRSFLHACSDTLALAGLNPIVATIPPMAQTPNVRGCTCHPLPTPDLDMFGSLRYGLQKLLGSSFWRAVIILPVDHPLVTPTTVTRLLAADRAASIPRYRGRHGHPLCLGRSTAEGIVQGNHPGPTLREVLKAVEAVDVEVDDPGIRANCNTPEALARAWNPNAV